ncbi:AF4/FMR2 family member 4 [Eufriesea mexicana]|nr:AF4/FMR2 family member 4 [Eufriesea mexicana]
MSPSAITTEGHCEEILSQGYPVQTPDLRTLVLTGSSGGRLRGRDSKARIYRVLVSALIHVSAYSAYTWSIGEIFRGIAGGKYKYKEGKIKRERVGREKRIRINSIKISRHRGREVQVNPDARDSTTQQIQLKLGNYSLVKHLLDEPKRLIGIEGVPPSPAPPPAPSALRMSSSSVGSNSRSSPSSQEFKKPGGPRTDGSSSSSSASSTSTSSSSSSSSSSSHQRGGFVKPADGKPPHGGRGGYPGQPVKHGGNSNDHRSHGLLPAKGPPTNSPGNGTLVGNSNIGNSSGSRLHCVGSRLSRLPLDNGTSSSRPGPTENSADVENILKEMTMPPTPLTAIAQTPRKELESKFTFNPVLAKLTEVTPQEATKPRKDCHPGLGYHPECMTTCKNCMDEIFTTELSVSDERKSRNVSECPM